MEIMCKIKNFNRNVSPIFYKNHFSAQLGYKKSEYHKIVIQIFKSFNIKKSR